MTEIETQRRATFGAFLRDVLAEANVGLRPLAAAMSENVQGDVRGAIRAYRAGNRTITAGPAVNLGEAFRGSGVSWANGGIALYAAGFFSEWVRYVWCLREVSHAAGIIETFATASIANQMNRAFAAPAPQLGEENNELIRVVMHDGPRSHLSRIPEAVLAEAASRWRRGDGMTPTVGAALLFDAADGVRNDVRERVCVSLAVHGMKSFAGADDVAVLRLYNTMYASYFRRLAVFKHDTYEGTEWAAPDPLTVGAVDEVLHMFLPAPRFVAKDDAAAHEIA